ncbi:tissue factor pathway inhibitor-like [Hyposmocoma kahamanoa]|uniref:tissue factor pathway inhibitor-like n=1 Tax=Hyposmocoma kahamanoa TaxID=1477025 RepID=UPI000E6D5C6F|nr:tissue factor pathway inhibitor-like [Hyposmocoma kahamanoa]
MTGLDWTWRKDYKDSKDAIDYNDDFIEKYSTENYEDFNRWGDKRDRKHLSTVRNKNIGTGERKTRKNQRTIRFRAGKINGNKIEKTRKPLKTIKYTEKSFVTQNKNRFTRKYCVDVNNTLRARHKSCFLRPDTGPCRADIIQWYYDARLNKCFRFFWGGCQGNGNKFENNKNCMGYCFLNSSLSKDKMPYFCNLPFDFGTCFGHYYRWYWDRYTRVCKRRLYSGCGGNQNNFQSYDECFGTCVNKPNITIYIGDKGTTCFPID